MSKSYGNYKTLGIATGSNTEYYRNRRKHQRRVNHNRLKTAMTNNYADEIDDVFNPYIIPKENQWNEPTDGHIKYSAKQIRRRIENSGKPGWFGVYVTKNNKVKK